MTSAIIGEDGRTFTSCVFTVGEAIVTHLMTSKALFLIRSGSKVLVPISKRTPLYFVVHREEHVLKRRKLDSIYTNKEDIQEIPQP